MDDLVGVSNKPVEVLLIPNNAGLSHGGGGVVAAYCAGFLADNAIEARAEPIIAIFDRVAGTASVVVRDLAGVRRRLCMSWRQRGN